jgi:DHA2 family methylenomycin A resistance protein-like MFS transporter
MPADPVHSQPMPTSTNSHGGWATVAASFGFVVVQLDITIVNVALPAMAGSLQADTAGLQWVVDAYTMTFAVFLLTAGALGDRFGARRLYLAGFALFAVASLACGLAPSAGALIVARAVQGAGAALMVPNSLAVLNHATGHDPKLRAAAVGAWTAAGGVALGAGPVIGGALIAAVGWPSIFLVNLPLCLIGAALTASFTPRHESGAGDRRLDLPGQLLVTLAMLGLIGGVIEARPLGMAHPLVIAAFATALVAGAGFILVERRAGNPMIPLGFFADAAFGAAIGFGVAVSLAYYGVLFVLALYLQGVLHYSALAAGLAILPLTATFIVSNLVSGWLIGRFGSRAPMAFGGAIAVIGYLLLTTLGPHASLWQMLPIFVLIPAGMGLGVPAMLTSMLAGVDKTRAGIASGILNAARQGAAAIGVALFGALAATDAVRGLHHSALLSALAVTLAAAGAWAFIGRPRPAPVTANA